MFSWDENKRRLNIENHDVDLLYAALMFGNRDDLMVMADRRRDYGELRLQAIGRVEDAFYFLVYTKRRGVRHLISAWRLNDESRQRYQNRNPRRH